MQKSRLQTYSKIIICLGGMILLSVGASAYATTPESTWNASQGLQQIITVFSRLWVVLAMGAGKLMSNTFVYGEFMNFDIYLWQMWNISKNFANMAIGLMFLFYVRKIIFMPDKLTGSEVGKKIGGFLLAGVLIQASWFMMGALLDIEKIATSAMGALPGLVIQDNNTWGQKITGAMGRSGIQGNRFELIKSTTNPVSFEVNMASGSTAAPVESTLDAIMPTHNTLSGPLYFIGFAVFQFQEYSKMNIDESLTLKDLSWIVTGTGIKFLILAAFVIMMFLLFIINIVRVAYLWMVIALAPIIVLYLVMKDVLGMDLGSGQEGIMSKINVQTILAYIFQPTIIITFMGLMLIAVTALWQEMGPEVTNIEEYGFTITNTGVTHSTFEFETKGNLFNQAGEASRGIFKDLIILGLVFALLLGLITLSASSLKIDFVKRIADKLGPALLRTPFMPVFSMGGAANKILEDTTGISLVGPNAGRLDVTGHDALSERFGDPKIGDKDDQKFIRSLNQNISNPEVYFDTIKQQVANKGDTGLATSTQGFLPSLTNFIKENHTRSEFNRLGLSTLNGANLNDEEIKNFGIKDLKKYLEHDNNAVILYRQMTGEKPIGNNQAIAQQMAEGTLNLKRPKTETKKP